MFSGLPCVCVCVCVHIFMLWLHFSGAFCLPSSGTTQSHPHTQQTLRTDEFSLSLQSRETLSGSSDFPLGRDFNSIKNISLSSPSPWQTLLILCDKSTVINLTAALDSKFHKRVCSKLLLNSDKISRSSLSSFHASEPSSPDPCPHF